MAQEVGTAYVTVQPSARGFGKSVEGELTGSVGSAEKKSSGILKGMWGKVAKWGSIAAGTVVAAFTIKGGISRALNIEDAQAKLKGLGHDAKSVDQIMVDALASVKGTAFGLDAAATTAASAVASGIKPGQELERYLKLTADAATIAGVSMEEMGSIINKTTAKGKVSMEDLNRLTERGIPILQMLADEYGVSAEEMAKMVSKGEVDAARFRKALEDNVGGAALESGNTTRGAFANMGAALSRLGVTIIQPFYDQAKSVFNEITIFIDGLNDRLKPFMERFGEAFGSKATGLLDGFGERMLGVLDRVVKPIMTLMSFLSPFGIALKLIGTIFGEVGDGALSFGEGIKASISFFSNALMSVVTDILPTILVEILKAAPVILEAAVDVFMGLVEGLAAVLPLLITTVADMLPLITVTIMRLLPMLITTITDLVLGLIPVLVGLVPSLVEASSQLFTGLIDGLLRVLPVLLTTVSDVVPQLVGAITTMVPLVLEAGLQLFMGLVDAMGAVLPILVSTASAIIPQIVGVVTQLVPMLVSTITGLVTSLVPVLVGLLPVLVTAALQLFTGLVDGLLQVIPILLEAMLEIVPLLVDAIITMVPLILEAGVQLLMGLLDGILEMLPELAVAALEIINTLLTGIMELLPMIIESGIGLLLALVQGLIDSLPVLLETAITLVMGLLAAILDNLPLLIDAGIQLLLSLIQGLINALPQLITAAITLVLSLVSGILENLPKLIESGVQLVVSLIGGLIKAIPQIVAAIPQLVRAIKDGFTGVDWAGLGSQLVNGIIGGISSMGSALWDAAVGVAQSALDGAKNFLGIKSPSRRARQEIGRPYVQGVVLGIEDEAGLAVDASRALSMAVADAFVLEPPPLTSPSASFAASSVPGFPSELRVRSGRVELDGTGAFIDLVLSASGLGDADVDSKFGS